MQIEPRLPFPELRPRSGVLVVDGFGISIKIRNGNLTISDGIGPRRRERRLSRASREVRRLILLGHTGYITLEALRWMTDVGIGFAQIDSNGRVVTISGPLGRNDARLRRAQALSLVNGTGLGLARDLIARKLQGQARILQRLGADAVRDKVLASRAALDNAPSLDAVRRIEADAAQSYWQSWAGVEMCFDKKSTAVVPDHWRRFGQRGSPLAIGARLAINAPNAILNYCYALAEIECTLALLAVGLDPGLGVLHADQKARDSMSLDLLEVIRPDVDEWVLKLVTRPSRAKDFHETRQGVCRILPPLSHLLGETLREWRRLAAPVAEHLSKTFADDAQLPRQATPLTGENRSKGRPSAKLKLPSPTPAATAVPPACKGCGEILPSSARRYCEPCYQEMDHVEVFSQAGISALARMRADGRDPSGSGDARAKVGRTNLEWRQARLEWEANHAEMPDPASFTRAILPRLRDLPLSRLVAATGLSLVYCSRTRRGIVIPHPMHWEALSRAAG